LHDCFSFTRSFIDLFTSFYYTFRQFKDILKSFFEVLADRDAARSMIGCWHDTAVCLCVCLSVCDAVYWGIHGRCRGLKVVPSCF